MQVGRLGAAKLWDIPNFIDARQRDAVLHDLPMLAAHLGNPNPLVSYRWSRWNVPEVFCDLLFGGLEIHVASYDKNGVRRTIVGLKPIFHIVERSSIQILHRADDRV